MRSPPNESLARVNRDEPERRCIITGERGPKSGLIRLALSPDGDVAPDVRARAPGRGAWIGVDRTALEAALAKGKLKGGLARAFKGAALSIPAELGALIEACLARTALDRLGLEARAGKLMTGSDRIEEAARRGRLHLLLHASDAGDDGCRKLAQAWRVGSGAEGTGKSGIALIADRDQLSRALGRENSVHIGITEREAAIRVSRELARWHEFIGRDWPSDLAESAAKVQGGAAHDEKQEAGLDR
jgi:predicted RNA-binding protein YlxR (DUF448 family)